MNSQSPTCVFCENLLLGRSNAHWDRVLVETSDFVITPSKGSLVPGWLLVTSKRHALCAGALNTAEINGLKSAMRIAGELLRKSFGSVVFFEHGPAVTGSQLGCGIDHLHIHAVPLKFSLKTAFDVKFGRAVWREATDWTEFAALHASGIGYVAVQDGKCLQWAIPPSNVRQPLRRVIADQLGISERFDYREYPEIDNVLQTIAAFTGVVA